MIIKGIIITALTSAVLCSCSFNVEADVDPIKVEKPKVEYSPQTKTFSKNLITPTKPITPPMTINSTRPWLYGAGEAQWFTSHSSSTKLLNGPLVSSTIDPNSTNGEKQLAKDAIKDKDDKDILVGAHYIQVVEKDSKGNIINIRYVKSDK